MMLINLYMERVVLDLYLQIVPEPGEVICHEPLVLALGELGGDIVDVLVVAQVVIDE